MARGAEADDASSEHSETRDADPPARELQSKRAEPKGRIDLQTTISRSGLATP